MRFALRAQRFLDEQIQQREHLREQQATYLGSQQMQKSQLQLRRRSNGQCEYLNHLEVQKVRKRQLLRKLRGCEIDALNMRQHLPEQRQRFLSSSRCLLLRRVRGSANRRQRQVRGVKSPK